MFGLADTPQGYTVFRKKRYDWTMGRLEKELPMGALGIGTFYDKLVAWNYLGRLLTFRRRSAEEFMQVLNDQYRNPRELCNGNASAWHSRPGDTFGLVHYMDEPYVNGRCDFGPLVFTLPGAADRRNLGVGVEARMMAESFDGRHRATYLIRSETTAPMSWKYRPPNPPENALK